MSRYRYDGDEHDDYDRGRRDGDWWSSSCYPPSHESEPYQDGYRDGHREYERRAEERAEEERQEQRRADERAYNLRQEEAVWEAEQEAAYLDQQCQEPTIEEMCGPDHAPCPDRPFPRCYCGKVIWLREVAA